MKPRSWTALAERMEKWGGFQEISLGSIRLTISVGLGDIRSTGAAGQWVL